VCICVKHTHIYIYLELRWRAIHHLFIGHINQLRYLWEQRNGESFEVFHQLFLFAQVYHQIGDVYFYSYAYIYIVIAVSWRWSLLVWCKFIHHHLWMRHRTQLHI
jgi:hypothetical protein